jgi:DNA-binding MurR/RpiR family transcriptional regulator
MTDHHKTRFLQSIATAELTPKARILSLFIQEQPHKAVFMTARMLAKACQVSEATVVRFVTQLGYRRYGEFQKALRAYMDSELTLMERMDLTSHQASSNDPFIRVIRAEIDNIETILGSVDMSTLTDAVTAMQSGDPILVIGARLSYSVAYYLGWSLTKIKPNIHILRGSDRTCIDRLTTMPEGSLVIIVAMTRFPNELIRLGKYARRLGHKLLLIADGDACPLIPYADHALIAPPRHLPVLGSPTHLSCLVNYMVHELARRMGEQVKAHQARLEQAYLEHDILF